METEDGVNNVINPGADHPLRTGTGIRGADQINADPAGNMEQNRENVGLEAVHKALAQHLVLERIVNFAIRGDESGVCNRTVKVIRLVGKPWKDAVSTVLRNNAEPLYNLRLTIDNFPDGRELDRFCQFYREQEPAPTFGISIYFRLGNYKMLHRFLEQHGQTLVKLKLEVSSYGERLSGSFHNLSLPVLREMEVDLRPYDLRSEEELVLMLGSILNGNESLKMFEIITDGSLPAAFSHFQLPASITTLNVIIFAVDNRHGIIRLENCLKMNELPNLSTLMIRVDDKYFGNWPFLQLLDKFGSTLRSFKLIMRKPFNCQVSVLSPVLPKLESLIVGTEDGGDCFEFDVGAKPISALFPKLRKLDVGTFSPEMLQIWTSVGLPMATVEELDLKIVREGDENGGFFNWQPITVEIMQSVRSTFANLRKLSLHTTGTEVDGLKYLVMELRHLKDLSIVVGETKCIGNSDLWDSLLIGMPVECIDDLWAVADSWNDVQIDDEAMPSIRMLSELKTLRLNGVDFNGGDPLISELSFRFALMKMQKLKSLEFRGSFYASEDVAEEWRRKGGEYNWSRY